MRRLSTRVCGRTKLCTNWIEFHSVLGPSASSVSVPTQQHFCTLLSAELGGERGKLSLF